MPALAHSVSLKSIAAVIGGGRTFTPSSLFAAGEQGAWYDPSDFSTMFQDSAGTTPVTAVEQPVGLILDKSKSLALGSEVVTNGTFDNGSTGWTVGSNWAVSGGTATATAAVYNTNNLDWAGVILVTGRTYKLTFTITAYSAGSLRLDVVGAQSVITGGVTATGSYTYYFVAQGSGSQTLRFTGSTGGGFSGTIDNISVREIAGTHASQTTSTSRPVLSARVNLLTYTEQFDNAAWVSFNTTKTATSLTLTSTVGGAYQNKTIVLGRTYIFSCKIKRGTNNYAFLSLSGGSGTYASAVFDLLNGTTGETKVAGTGYAVTSTSISASGDHYLCTMVASYGSSGPSPVQVIGFAPAATGNTWDAFGDPTGCTSGNTLFVKEADLRVTNDGVGIPSYQRVAAATDYDTTGFPYYLSFDGTDDSLATAAIDFSATDKMSVFAGARKIADASYGALVEMSANNENNAGTFALMVANGSRWDMRLKGNTVAGSYGGYFANTDAAPVTNVATMLSNLGASTIETKITPRVNGVVTASSNYGGAAGIGTGNFGNQPLYIGSRGGSSLRFNGRLYSLIVVGRTATSTEITNTEAWVNSKTKAY